MEHMFSLFYKIQWYVNRNGSKQRWTQQIIMHLTVTILKAN